MKQERRSRTINLRLLILSVAAVALVAGTLYGWHSLRVQQTAKVLLERADRQEGEGKPQQAAVSLRRYLALFPDDPDARLRLATNYSATAQTPEQHRRASIALYRVLADQPKRWDLRKDLIRHLFEVEYFVAAEREAIKLRQLDEYAQDPQVISWQGRSLATRLRARGANPIRRADAVGSDESPMMEFVAAVQEAEKLLKLVPGDPELATAVAQLYREFQPAFDNRSGSHLPAVQTADQLMRNMVRSCEDKADALLAEYAYYLRYEPESHKALENLELAIAEEPDHVEARLFLAAELASSAQELSPEEVAEIEGHLQQVLKVAPTEYHASTRLAELYAQQGRPQEAVAVLEKAQADLEDDDLLGNVFVQLALGGVHIASGDTQRARRMLDDVSKAVHAVDFVKNVRAAGRRLINDRINAAFARLAFVEQDWQIAIDQLAPLVSRSRGAIDQDREWFAAAQLLGRCYEQIGNWEQAADLWMQLAPRVADYYLAAAAGWRQAGFGQDALNALRRYERATGSRPLEQLLLTEVSLQSRAAASNWSQVEELIAEVHDAGLNSREVVFAEAEYLRLAQGAQSRERLLGLLESAEVRFADDAEFWRQVASWYAGMGMLPNAELALARYRAIAGNTVAATRLEAQLLTADDRLDAAINLIAAAADAADPSERSSLRFSQIQLMRMDDRGEEAQQVIRQFIDDSEVTYTSSTQQFVEAAALLAIGEQDWQLAVDLEEKLAKEMEGASADQRRYMAARRQLIQAATQQARPSEELAKSVTAIRSARPRWYPGMVLAAMLADLQGDHRTAIQEYQRAVEAGAVEPATMQRLAGLLLSESRFQEAGSVLTQAAARRGGSNRTAALREHLAVREGRFDDALAIARERLAANPEDPLAHIITARLAFEQEDHSQGLAQMAVALEKFSNDPRVWFSMLQLQLVAGQQDEAELLLERLEQSPVEPIGRHRVAAAYYQTIGDRPAALARYREALKYAPADPAITLQVARLSSESDPRSAIQLLEGAYQVAPNDVSIKRQLVLLYANSGRKSDWDKIDRLFDEQQTLTPFEQQLQATLLARKGETRQQRIQNTERARNLLGKQLDATVGTDQDSVRAVLARIYVQLAELQSGSERSAALQQAQLHLRQLAVDSEASAAVMQRYLGFLLKFAAEIESPAGGDPLAEARQLLDRLRVVGGSESRLSERLATLLLEARLKGLQSEGDIEPAISQLVEEFVTRESPQADLLQQVQLFHGAAQICAALKVSSSADRWYRRLLEVRPAAYAHYTKFLVSQDQRLEAAQVCLEHGEGDADLASNLVDVLVGNTDKRARELAWPVIEAAVKTNPNDATLLAKVSTIHAVSGDTNEAIKLLDRAANLEPNNASTLNNLATLLGEDPRSTSQAQQLIDHALKLAGQQPPLLDTKGTILLLAGDVQGAIACLERATAGAGADPRFTFHLAAAYSAAGRKQEARESLRSAEEAGLKDRILTRRDHEMLKQLRNELGHGGGRET